MTNINNKKELDCLLIAPSPFYIDPGNIWKEISSNFPPLGLASLAGYIRDKNKSVKILDCEIEVPSVENFSKYFTENYTKTFSQIKVIGITSMTPTIKKALKIAEICKKLSPDSCIVFGGVHPTFVKDEVISNKFVDIVVIGEGEETLYEICLGKKKSEISGICYKEFNSKANEFKIITNPPRKRLKDINSIPMPAYDLLPISKYRPAKGSYKRLPAMSMVSSRGCPGRCTFCNKTLGTRLAFRSAENILEEIEFLIDRYNIKEILFYDDTFTIYKKNVIKLCDLIIEKNIDITWTCFARVDFIDLNMLKKMKKAGCHQIMYGVENIDEKIVKNINKKINLDQIINANKWTKKVGIECRLAFMVGNPGDSKEIILKNIKFVNKINPDLLVVNVATPFPGTEMFRWAKEKDLILSYDWDDYNLEKPTMRLENLTADEIRDLYRLMYRKFYIRPRYIIQRLLSLKNFNDIKIMLDGFKAVVSLLISKKAA